MKKRKLSILIAATVLAIAGFAMTQPQAVKALVEWVTVTCTPTASVTPKPPSSATPDPNATKRPTSTPIPGSTKTPCYCTVTVSPSATIETETSSPTVPPTTTPSPTDTLTSTPSATDTTTATVTLTATATSTPTSSSTHTPSPTAPSQTPTAVPSGTPASPTPEKHGRREGKPCPTCGSGQTERAANKDILLISHAVGDCYNSKTGCVDESEKWLQAISLEPGKLAVSVTVQQIQAVNAEIIAQNAKDRQHRQEIDFHTETIKGHTVVFVDLHKTIGLNGFVDYRVDLPRKLTGGLVPYTKDGIRWEVANGKGSEKYTVACSISVTEGDFDRDGTAYRYRYAGRVDADWIVFLMSKGMSYNDAYQWVLKLYAEGVNTLPASLMP